MKNKPYWALKTRFGSWVKQALRDTEQVLLFATRREAQAHADGHLPPALRPQAVKVSVTIQERP